MPITVGPRNEEGWRSPRFNVVIKNHIATYREAAGLTSGELAQRLGMTRQNLDYIEHQQSRPMVDTLAQCAQVLGLARWTDLIEVQWLSEPEPVSTEEILSHG